MAAAGDDTPEYSGGTNQSTKVGEHYVIEAGTSLTLKCGAGSININQAGVITIAGTMINIGAAININIAAPVIANAAGLFLAGAGVATWTASVSSYHVAAKHTISGGEIRLNA
jgi:hypothetical protein